MCAPLQWQHEDILGPNNQPLSVSIPPRSIILSNMKKKLYKLSQDEGAIVAIQVSITPHTHPVFSSSVKCPQPKIGQYFIFLTVQENAVFDHVLHLGILLLL